MNPFTRSRNQPPSPSPLVANPRVRAGGSDSTAFPAGVSMYLISTILICIAFAGQIYAANVRIHFSQPFSTAPDTSAVIATPISTNVLADGSVISVGLPVRIQPGADGLATNFFNLGWYALRNTKTGSSVVINVYDSSSTLYDYTNFLQSGFNTYAVTVFGTNPPPTFDEITNGLGYKPLTPQQTTNAAAQQASYPTNGIFTVITNAAIYESQLATNPIILRGVALTGTGGSANTNGGVVTINLSGSGGEATNVIHVATTGNLISATTNGSGLLVTLSGISQTNTLPSTYAFSNTLVIASNSLQSQITGGTVATNAWNLSGNSGLPSTSFIGTTDNRDFVIQSHGVEVARFSDSLVPAVPRTIFGVSQTATATAYGVIGGGHGNTNDGVSATISGGAFNYAHGTGATVPGGANNQAESYSLAAGRQAKAVNSGTFVWNMGDGSDFSSTSNNQFLIRASGGVGINTNNPGTNALKIVGNVDSTVGYTVNGVPLGFIDLSNLYITNSFSMGSNSFLVATTNEIAATGFGSPTVNGTFSRSAGISWTNYNRVVLTNISGNYFIQSNGITLYSSASTPVNAAWTIVSGSSPGGDTRFGAYLMADGIFISGVVVSTNLDSRFVKQSGGSATDLTLGGTLDATAAEVDADFMTVNQIGTHTVSPPRFTGGVAVDNPYTISANGSGLSNAVDLIAGANVAITTNAGKRSFTISTSVSGITNTQSGAILPLAKLTNAILSQPSMFNLSSGAPTPGVLTLLPDGKVFKTTQPVGLDISSATNASGQTVAQQATNAAQAIPTLGFQDFFRARTLWLLSSNQFTFNNGKVGHFVGANYSHVLEYLRDKKPCAPVLTQSQLWDFISRFSTNTTGGVVPAALNNNYGALDTGIDCARDLVSLVRYYDEHWGSGHDAYDSYGTVCSNAVDYIRRRWTTNHLVVTHGDVVVEGFQDNWSTISYGTNSMGSGLYLEMNEDMATMELRKGNLNSASNYVYRCGIIKQRFQTCGAFDESIGLCYICVGDSASPTNHDPRATSYLADLGLLDSRQCARASQMFSEGSPGGSRYSTNSLWNVGAFRTRLLTECLDPGTDPDCDGTENGSSYQTGGFWTDAHAINVLLKYRPELAARLMADFYAHQLVSGKFNEWVNTNQTPWSLALIQGSSNYLWTAANAIQFGQFHIEPPGFIASPSAASGGTNIFFGDSTSGVLIGAQDSNGSFDGTKVVVGYTNTSLPQALWGLMDNGNVWNYGINFSVGGFDGPGAGITGINASHITTGTFTGNGSGLTNVVTSLGSGAKPFVSVVSGGGLETNYNAGALTNIPPSALTVSVTSNNATLSSTALLTGDGARGAVPLIAGSGVLTALGLTPTGNGAMVLSSNPSITNYAGYASTNYGSIGKTNYSWMDASGWHNTNSSAASQGVDIASGTINAQSGLSIAGTVEYLRAPFVGYLGHSTLSASSSSGVVYGMFGNIFEIARGDRTLGWQWDSGTSGRCTAGGPLNMAGFAVTNVLVAYYDTSTFPTSSVPVGSATATNVLEFVYQGLPRIVATNRAVGGWMRWRTTDETWQSFTP